MSEDNLPEMKDRPEGWVYLMQCRDLHKIGRTTNLESRRCGIQSDMGKVVTIVWSWFTEDAAGLERAWHARFKELRVKGEWFRLEASHVEEFKTTTLTPTTSREAPLPFIEAMTRKTAPRWLARALGQSVPGRLSCPRGTATKRVQVPKAPRERKPPKPPKPPREPKPSKERCSGRKGGKRPGAGQPRKGKEFRETVSVRLEPSLIAWMDRQPDGGRAETIEAGLETLRKERGG